MTITNSNDTFEKIKNKLEIQGWTGTTDDIKEIFNFSNNLAAASCFINHLKRSAKTEYSKKVFLHYKKIINELANEKNVFKISKDETELEIETEKQVFNFSMKYNILRVLNFDLSLKKISETQSDYDFNI